MIDLLEPLTLVKLGWTFMALITFVVCLFVWRPLHKVSVIAHTEHNDPGLLAWVDVPLKIAAGLAAIAALNLLAGLVSLALPPPPPQPALPDVWAQLLTLVIPCLLILVAGVVLVLATILHASYKRVITTGKEAP